ncbi:MAG: nitrous oxide reductase accessory protein NosL [Candidatus Fervidibacter sp.]|uniref:nitrous oxide reductase accessory protein NosL n=1 Tax=Candidatus Fervidibacter sp. TaxID=3100871 RepID=UPI00404A40E4
MDVCVGDSVGCRSQLDVPPTVRYGEDACAERNMLINDCRFAAAFVTEKGKWFKFDDIGCLLKLRGKFSEPIHRFWVCDYQQEGKWLDAEKAWFVSSEETENSMGYGLAALQTQKDAEALARKENGKVLKFEQLETVIHRPPKHHH